MVEQEIFSSLSDFSVLPTDELSPESFQNGRSWTSAVDEHQAETSWWMFQAEAGQNVGTKIMKMVAENND